MDNYMFSDSIEKTPQHYIAERQASFFDELNTHISGPSTSKSFLPVPEPSIPFDLSSKNDMMKELSGNSDMTFDKFREMVKKEDDQLRKTDPKAWQEKHKWDSMLKADKDEMAKVTEALKNAKINCGHGPIIYTDNLQRTADHSPDAKTLLPRLELTKPAGPADGFQGLDDFMVHWRNKKQYNPTSGESDKTYHQTGGVSDKAYDPTSGVSDKAYDPTSRVSDNAKAAGDSPPPHLSEKQIADAAKKTIDALDGKNIAEILSVRPMTEQARELFKLMKDAANRGSLDELLKALNQELENRHSDFRFSVDTSTLTREINLSPIPDHEMMFNESYHSFQLGVDNVRTGERTGAFEFDDYERYRFRGPWPM